MPNLTNGIVLEKTPTGATARCFLCDEPLIHNQPHDCPLAPAKQYNDLPAFDPENPLRSLLLFGLMTGRPILLP